tara:strand:- start:92 stop:457 length:366 start_codon:yes stop_codon:yes gene_type:complete
MTNTHIIELGLTTATENVNWNRVAKKSGYSTVEITLEDGTPNGTMQWNYMRGQGCDCWLVTRHDNDDNQVGEGNYMAANRSELPAILKEMASKTILDLDPWHKSGWSKEEIADVEANGIYL